MIPVTIKNTIDKRSLYMDKFKIDIKLARHDEITQIANLNKKWLKNDFMMVDREHGFLFGDSFDENDLKRIVDNKELIVAKSDDLIIGYYLLDNYSGSTILEDHKHLISKHLMNEDYFVNSKISMRMQCVIDLEFQMLGLSRAMLKQLLTALDNKYDFLFATVSKHNPKYKAHLKLGWEKFHETEDLYLLLFNCRKEKMNT